jgi:hypothetical protein
MVVFIAYTTDNVPIGISKSLEDTKDDITRIEAEYKITNPKLVGRTYTIVKAELVSDKLNPYNIIRTIPIQEFKPLKFKVDETRD